jgi:hypothetical protein
MMDDAERIHEIRKRGWAADTPEWEWLCGRALAGVGVIGNAIDVERERIANCLEGEADLSPCKEDAAVLRSTAFLVRADFSYEEAERLETAAEAAAASD